MNHFSKLANHYRESPGLELTILRNIPIVLLGGTLIIFSFSVFSRVYPPDGTARHIAKHLGNVDILSIASVLSVWMMALTIVIGCIAVVVTKAPVYVAVAN